MIRNPTFGSTAIPADGPVLEGPADVPNVRDGEVGEPDKVAEPVESDENDK